MHPKKVETAAEHGSCGGAQGEAAGTNLRVFDKDAVDGIELVEARGEGLEVGRDRMHLTPCGRVLYDAGIVEQLEHEEALFGCEIPCRDLARCLGVRARPLEDAGYPGVGVLHVEDGVLFGVLYSEVQVEVHLRLVGRAYVEVARHVLPHLVEQLVEGHYVARPLAELDLLTLPHELHEPNQFHVEELTRQSERDEAGPDTRRVAGVIRAEHVNGGPETAIPLVAVVGEIRTHVRV